MNIIFNKIITFFIPLSFVIIFAYAIDTGLYLYLPKSKSVKLDIKDIAVQYKKYNIKKAFKEHKKKIKIVKQQKKSIKPEYQLLSQIVLKAIYATANSKHGWIIISEKNINKTYILSVGDLFKKYKLIDVFPKYVLFKKYNKISKVLLDNSKIKTKYTYTQNTHVKNDVIFQDNTYKLRKTILEKYIQNPKQIWNNISIKEIKRNGKIDGFKVLGLRRGSIFDKLGLQKGDIIKEVNNIKLKSYANALLFYKKIKKIKNIHLLILRDNIEMELDYEIK